MKSYFLLFCNIALLGIILYLYQCGVYTSYLNDKVEQEYNHSFSLFEKANEIIERKIEVLDYVLQRHTSQELASGTNQYRQQAKELTQQNKVFCQHTDSLIALLSNAQDYTNDKAQRHVQAMTKILEQNKEAEILHLGLVDSLLQTLQQATKIGGTAARALLNWIRMENSLLLEEKLEHLQAQSLLKKPIIYDTFTPHVILNQERFKVGDTLRAKISLIASAAHAPTDVYINNKKLPFQSNGMAYYKQVCKEAGEAVVNGRLLLAQTENDSVRFYFNYKYQVKPHCTAQVIR